MDLLITGGTGSLGTALLDALTGRLRSTHPYTRIIVYSRDEVKQSQLAASYSDDRLRWFLGDVRDEARLTQAFKGVTAVIHAAALKRVDKVAYDPEEVLKTNVLGTANVLRAAVATKVERVLLVSSDKAVAATNVYGSTKMLAECLTIASNVYAYPQGSIFATVRYWNVLGSRGSVLQLWRHLLASGSPLPITSPRCTRFWLTLDHAVDFVLRALQEARGGEIFVPKLKAAKLTDLAQALAPDYPTEVIGLRLGGEKLHEQLLNDDELARTLDIGWAYVVEPALNYWGSKPWKGTRVPKDRPYQSNKVGWYTVEEIRELLTSVP